MNADTAHQDSLRLNLGCGHVTPAGWVNVDYFIGARLVSNPLGRVFNRIIRPTRHAWSSDIHIHDLRRPLPWSDGTVQTIYSSHSLEHLTLEAGQRLLRECHRVLQPDGIIRIVVPDLSHFVDLYRKGDIQSVDFLDRLSVFAEMPGDGRLKKLLAPYVRFPHKCMYDSNGLISELTAAGFNAADRPAFDSGIDRINDVERADGTVGAVIVEGKKRS